MYPAAPTKRRAAALGVSQRILCPILSMVGMIKFMSGLNLLFNLRVRLFKSYQFQSSNSLSKFSLSSYQAQLWLLQQRVAQIALISQLQMFIITYLLAILVAIGQAKLYQVVSMFRHGARYSTNSYYDGDSTKEWRAELTSVGMKQHQTLGKMLRKDYIDNLNFLSDMYKDGETEIYSTDVNRTFQSARSQFYGLYGLGKGRKLIDVDVSYHIPPYSLKKDSSESTFALPKGYQQVPVLVNPDIVMTSCTNFDRDLDRNVARQINTYNEMNITYYPFLKRMAQVFNVSQNQMNFQVIQDLYDTLTVDKSLGRPMPASNFTQDDYLNMRHLHYWYNFFKMSSNISNALSTGKLKKVIKDFDERIINLNNPHKWTFLSCHDVDVTCMLLDLNISTAACIEQKYRKGSTSALNCSPDQQYATSIIFELHSDDEGLNHYVKIRHNGKYVYLCQKKQLFCDYKEWKQRIQQKVLVDIQKICQGP